ncbi:MAG: WbuC family cupin fold metalloprotein [Thiohalomonadales bacterium]
MCMPITKIIDQKNLERLCDQARESARLRCNYNLHPHLSDPVQRFCNALHRGTYVRPHRHIGVDRWELFVILQGKVGILLFDDDGKIVQRTVLEASGENQIIEIPTGQWHCLFALADNTVLFECKPGPYEKLTDKDFALWAPPEGDAAANQFVQWYEQALIGDRPPALGS